MQKEPIRNKVTSCRVSFSNFELAYNLQTMYPCMQLYKQNSSCWLAVKVTQLTKNFHFLVRKLIGTRISL